MLLIQLFWGHKTPHYIQFKIKKNYERERERERDNKNKKIDIYKKILVPKKITDIQIKKFFKNKNLNELINLSKLRDLKVNEMIINSPFKPELNDLYRLYQFIFLNKRTTVLEFGSGY